MRKLTLILITLSLLCFGAMNYIEYTHLQLISGGLKSPGLRITGYTFDELNAWREALGSNGANEYLKFIPLGFDAVFPALFGITLAMLVHSAFSQFARYRRLSVVSKLMIPLFFVTPYMFFDYFENTMMIDFLRAEFEWGPDFVQFASGLTIMKFASLAVLLIILIGFWLAGLKNRKQEAR